MSEASNEQFRVVLRGYDPAQVDRRIADLARAADDARQQLAQLRAHVHELEEDRDRALEEASTPAPPVEPGPATFAHLGERVGQILHLAEEEAEDLRSRARTELEAERESVTAEVARVRAEADRYAGNRRSDADTEAARILEDARRTADDRIDAADRDAAARLQEAEAVYEDQRARAAKAAADFETTLAARRQAAEQEFTQQMAETRRQLDEAQQFLEQTRAEAEDASSEAVREARRIVEEAEQHAVQIVSDAKNTAARVRAESERELAAATQRRDSINAQLANVRQMLATLTGGSAASMLADPFADGPGLPVQRPTPADGTTEDAMDAETTGQEPGEAEDRTEPAAAH